MRRTVLVLALTSLVSLVGDAASACASGHIQVNLDEFPAEAQSRALYWAAEGSNIPFTIKVFGTSCDGTTVTIDYVVNAGSASNGTDYSYVGTGQRTIVNGPGHTDRQTDTVGTVDDLPLPEPVVEQASVHLTSASNATLVDPTSAALLVVDADGASRASLAPRDYEEQEGSQNGGIPVFRGGATAADLPVSYTVTPVNATPGADYSASASGTVTIPANQRSAFIPIAVVDDGEREPRERLTVSITGSGPQDTSSVTFTIRDNEESEPPESTIHHPNNRKKYKNTDFRIREVHVFTKDEPGGSGVVAAEFAVRQNLKGGKCAWLSGKRFRSGDCDEPRWKRMDRYEANFYYLRMDPLPPNRGKLKTYTAFSRAIDGAGNVEVSDDVGDNANTFKVKKGKA